MYLFQSVLNLENLLKINLKMFWVRNCGVTWPYASLPLPSLTSHHLPCQLFIISQHHVTLACITDNYSSNKNKNPETKCFNFLPDICLIIYLDSKLITSLNFNRIIDRFICNSIPIIPDMVKSRFA